MDFYYSDDEAEEIVGEADEEDEDAGEEELLDSVALISPPHKTFKILKEEEIRQLQDGDISDVSNVLSVTRNVACTLLCQNNWTPSSVYDKWFGGDAQQQQQQPIMKLAKPPKKEVCKICYETTRVKNKVIRNTLSAACGHLFCVDCWKTYISTSIKDGPGCLTLPCPEPGCKSHPGTNMVDSLGSADDKDKYYRYLHRSYVESSVKRKWCPAPGCDFAIEFDVDGCDHMSYDVTCLCGYKLCWSCGEESHSPLGCETVAKWMEKNNSEAENTTWILAYTKPCPKCRRAIEKNQGCNHMKCGDPCLFEFCWTCLEPWTKHGYGQCNGYKGDKGGETQRSRKKAREHLKRYTHYYERWDSNDKSRKRALADLDTARNEHVDRLAEMHQESKAQLKFVIQAWDQIVECRRVLKWTYAYGYYLSSESGLSGKLKLFEHLQGVAEYALERLHHCAEKEMDKYLSADCLLEDFKFFRSKLADLTLVTKNYFENLVRALENNLCEVEVVGSKARKSPKCS